MAIGATSGVQFDQFPVRRTNTFVPVARLCDEYWRISCAHDREERQRNAQWISPRGFPAREKRLRHSCTCLPHDHLPASQRRGTCLVDSVGVRCDDALLDWCDACRAGGPHRRLSPMRARRVVRVRRGGSNLNLCIDERNRRRRELGGNEARAQHAENE